MKKVLKLQLSLWRSWNFKTYPILFVFHSQFEHYINKKVWSSNSKIHVFLLVGVAPICVIWPITTTLVVGDNTSYLQLHIEIVQWNSLFKSITLWHIITCEILQWWTPRIRALAFCDELPRELITTISKTCLVASFTLEHDFFTFPKLFINPLMTFS